jgi:hypothetical protein
MFLYCGCDRVGQIGESGSLIREGWEEGRGYSEVPRWFSGKRMRHQDDSRTRHRWEPRLHHRSRSPISTS